LDKEVLAAIPSGEAFKPKSESPMSDADKKALPITINGYITNNNLLFRLSTFGQVSLKEPRRYSPKL